jgi:hypothetical protein
MPQIIRIRDVGGGLARSADRLGRYRDNFPRLTKRMKWIVAQKNAKHMRLAAEALFSFPSGYTNTSLKAKKIGDDYGVTGPSYSWYTDVGRGPSSKGPPLTAKFVNWSNAAGINPRILSRSIARKGTRARPFIRYGIRNSRQEWKHSIAEHMDYFVKSGGRVI